MFSCCFRTKESELALSLSNQAYKAEPGAIEEYRQAMNYQDLILKNYQNQNKVAQYEQKYAEHLHKAAELKLADAQRWIGIHHISGESGFSKDRIQAREWLQLAANQEDKVAQQFLDFMATLRPDQPLPMMMMTADSVTFCT